MNLVTGLLIPFFGTTIGSATVFFLKNNLSEKRKRLFEALQKKTFL